MSKTTKPSEAAKAENSPAPAAGPRKPAHALGLLFIADDFDEPMPDVEADFEGEE